MSPLRRATSGFHQHGFRAELSPNRPTHAALPGAHLALCGASVEHVFTRQWGLTGPDVNGCPSCQAESARRSTLRVMPKT
jgi:hypothetical protein